MIRSIRLFEKDEREIDLLLLFLKCEGFIIISHHNYNELNDFKDVKPDFIFYSHSGVLCCDSKLEKYEKFILKQMQIVNVCHMVRDPFTMSFKGKGSDFTKYEYEILFKLGPKKWNK